MKINLKEDEIKKINPVLLYTLSERSMKLKQNTIQMEKNNQLHKTFNQPVRAAAVKVYYRSLWRFSRRELLHGYGKYICWK